MSQTPVKTAPPVTTWWDCTPATACKGSKGPTARSTSMSVRVIRVRTEESVTTSSTGRSTLKLRVYTWNCAHYGRSIAFVYFCAVMNVSVKALGLWETTVRKIFLSVHQILANMEELVSRALTITTAPVGQVTILYSV